MSSAILYLTCTLSELYPVLQTAQAEIPQVGVAGVTRPPRKHSHYSRATVVVWHLLLPVYASHGWIPFMWKCPYVITYKWQPRGVTSMRLLLLYSSPLSGQAVSYSISFYPSHITITQVLLNIFIVIHVWVGKVYVKLMYKQDMMHTCMPYFACCTRCLKK